MTTFIYKCQLSVKNSKIHLIFFNEAFAISFTLGVRHYKCKAV